MCVPVYPEPSLPLDAFSSLSIYSLWMLMGGVVFIGPPFPSGHGLVAMTSA